VTSEKMVVFSGETSFLKGNSGFIKETLVPSANETDGYDMNEKC
jgi:hypothetical protein